MRCHQLLPWKHLNPLPERTSGLGMQMNFRFLNGEDRFNAWPVSFCELLKHCCLKQEDDCETLQALAVMSKRQPRPKLFVAENDARSLQHLFDPERQCVEARRTRSLSNRDTRR